MAGVAGVLLDHVHEDPRRDGPGPSVRRDVDAEVVERGRAIVIDRSSTSRRRRRSREGVVRARVEVTVLVVIAVVQRWRIGSR